MKNPFSGMGFPELFVVVMIGVYIYGVVMTVDAIRRPADKFSIGNKYVWVIALLISNPLITKFAGGLFWLIGLFIYVFGSILYHLFIKKHKTFSRELPENSDNLKIYEKEI